MNASEINLPTPMTPEAHLAIQEGCLDSKLFAYGLSDWGTAAWYKEKYPCFTGKQYRIFEMHSNGMMAKQHRNAL